MKRLLLAAFVTVLLGATSAMATPVEFLISDLYDWGRLYDYDHVTGTYTPTNTNPYDGSTGSAIPQNVIAPDGQEDTWGTAQVDQIKDLLDNSLLFDKDQPGSYELTLFFYGFDDAALSDPNIFGTTTVASVGGHVEVWLDTTPDYLPSPGPAGRSDSSDPSHFENVTDDGILVLDLAPVLQGGGFSLMSNFDFVSNTGTGSIYLETTGLGAWDDLYDTNTQKDGSDFYFSFTSSPTGTDPNTDWVVMGAGRSLAAVPEPSTLILMGVGLLGTIVGSRRFRKS